MRKQKITELVWKHEEAESIRHNFNPDIWTTVGLKGCGTFISAKIEAFTDGYISISLYATDTNRDSNVALLTMGKAKSLDEAKAWCDFCIRRLRKTIDELDMEFKEANECETTTTS